MILGVPQRWRKHSAFMNKLRSSEEGELGNLERVRANIYLRQTWWLVGIHKVSRDSMHAGTSHPSFLANKGVTVLG